MTILTASLPEFLGSLAAGLLLGVGSWTVRRLRRRVAPTTPKPPPDSPYAATTGAHSDG